MYRNYIERKMEYIMGSYLLASSSSLELLFDRFIEQGLLIVAVEFFGFVILLNTIHYIVHKMNFGKYLRNREKLFAKQRKNHKFLKIIKDLEEHGDFNKLTARNKKRLTEYVTFLIKDMKYNMYVKHFTFGVPKRVNVKVISESGLGNYSGSVKKVTKRMIRASKRKTGLLDVILLLEEICSRKKFYGLQSNKAKLRFDYTLNWTV